MMIDFNKTEISAGGKYPALKVSLNTLKRAHKENEWVSTKPHHCQLIREEKQNKVQRVV